VREGAVSRAAAEQHYGVIVTERAGSWAIDEGRTRERRSRR